MKKRKLLGLVLTFASVFILASCANKTKQEEVREDINDDVVEFREEAHEEMHDFNNYTYTQKDKFVKDANEKLDDLNREIDRLKTELKNAGDNISAESRASYEKSIATLEKNRNDFKIQVAKAQDSSEDGWEKVKSDVANSYKKATDGIKQAWDEVRNFVGDGVDKIKDKLD